MSRGLTAIEALREHNQKEGDINEEKEELGKRTMLKNLITPGIKKDISGVRTLDLRDEKLLEGVSTIKLKEKYLKRGGGAGGFKAEDMQQFMEEGQGEEYGLNEDMVQGEDLKAEFSKEKEEEVLKSLPVEKKPLTGWGDWTGAGIAEKPVDKQAEEAKKKAQIELIQSKRRDGRQGNVIINEKIPQGVQEFMVDKLPHPFTSREQFEYLHSQPIGREWTGITHHDRLIQPSVQTRAGEVLLPISRN